ncbi:MAG: hypothetical protein RMJ66_03120 [Bacteroidia bacterium]|nr:hypothetical protein [Bacteroidia bacterium]
MMRSLQHFLVIVAEVLRFYPIQLPFFQLRRHFFLSLLWVVLWLIAAGQIGEGFGVEEIFYSPRVSFYPTWLTTFIWGAAYGIFVVAYHLTTYLLDGHHAAFLLRERYPFLQYALNNSLLPLSFWLFYLDRYVRHHLEEPNLVEQLLGHACGTIFVSGGLLSFLVFTTQDIFRLRRTGILPPQRIYQQISHAMSVPSAVRYYISYPKGIQATYRGLALDKKSLSKLLFQHHRNAFLLEMLLLLLIVLWGYLQGLLEIYLPASAALMILWAILYMLGGAVSFWLRQWGGWAIVGLIGLGILLVRSSWFYGSSPAYGLPYRGHSLVERPQISYERDSIQLVRCLDAWRARQAGKAPLIWIEVSGGGWRSAFWSLGNLQLLDSLTQGGLWRRTFAISGASGGLIGAALWREIGLFYPERRWNLSEPFFLTQDILNPIFSSGIVGLLSPLPTFLDSLTGERYVRGRGYAFERALVKHTGAFGRRRLGDYAPYEAEGRCPLLFITPAILSLGRQLLISSQPCSPLTRSGFLVELRQWCSQADKLYFTTALRMNASFPFVLPLVELPTRPPLEVTDAGAIDNYGELIAHQFLWQMRKAIAERASKVIIIEIRDLPSSLPSTGHEEPSALNRLFQRIGGLYTSFAQGRRLFMSLSYEILRAAYPIPVEKYVLAYQPEGGRIPPLGFTLMPRDQHRMLEALVDTLHLRRLRQIQAEIE